MKNPVLCIPSHLFVLNQRQLKWSSNNFFTFSGCKCLKLQVQPRFSTKYLQMLFMLSYTESLHCMRKKSCCYRCINLCFNSIFFFRLKTNLMESLASIRSSCLATGSSKTRIIHEVRSYSTIISKYSYMGGSLQAHSPSVCQRRQQMLYSISPESWDVLPSATCCLLFF